LLQRGSAGDFRDGFLWGSLKFRRNNARMRPLFGAFSPFGETLEQANPMRPSHPL
jgi:hypothetical protein